MERHDTLLISCGDKESRAHLRSVLGQRFNLLEAVNVNQTMLLLQQNMECICAVLVDSSMRHMNDKMELAQGSARALMDRIPVIVISEDNASVEDLTIFFRYGATDVIPLHYEEQAMLRRIETITDLHMHKQHLESIVQKQADTLRHSSDRMVDALSAIIECRSVESGNHILRVRNFTRILMEEVASRCPEYHITEREVSIISSASALHDIGKISIPDAILMKPGPLTGEETAVMRTHCITGCRILDNLKGTVDKEYLRYAHNICRYHHERWDGRGYPEGLSGDDIPICAQVVGLADAYDALTSERVYKNSYSFVEAVNTILKGECGVFSPKLLECFKNVTGLFDTLTREYADGRAAEYTPFDMSLPAPSQSQDDPRAMYHSLVHYLGAFVVEIELKQKIFHVVYNPYPELSLLQRANTIQELEELLLERVVAPEDRVRMEDVIARELPAFVEAGMRTASHSFRYRNQAGTVCGSFEMTLLRPGIAGQPRRYLTILLRKQDSGQTRWNEWQPGSLPANAYICRNDRDFTLVQVSQETIDMLGYSLQEICQTFGNKLGGLIHPEDRDMVRQEMDRQLQEGVLVRLEHRVVCRDGRVMWVANRSRLIHDSRGRENLYCSLSDISHTKAAYERLRQRMGRYEVILAQTENVLFEWDIATDTMDFSDTWEQVFGGVPRRESLRRILYDGSFFHPDDAPLIMDSLNALDGGSNYEIVEARIATSRGRYLWCRFRASAIRDGEGKLLKVVGIIINIDAEKQAQQALLDRADRDSLTKQLNKAAGRKHIEAYLSRFPDGVKCAMLIIDLDDFKGINDQYGHLFGDAVLTKTARIIEKQFQSQDIFSRIGGDEFLVLVRGVADRNLLENRCRTLIDNLKNAFHSLHNCVPLSCSVGVALGPEHGRDYYELFGHADKALYRAKAMGKNTFCFYEKQEASIGLAQPERTAVSTPIDSDQEPGLAEDNFVRFTFQKLYSAADVKTAVSEVIATLGRRMNVSRVYVFENTSDNRHCNNTFEWCNAGISPEIDGLQMISYETDIPGYADNFDEQGIFYLPDVSALPEGARKIVEAQGIKSMLQCAIRHDGVFRGYIGFDECVEQRMWTKEEIQMLTYFSRVLSLFLQKHREQEQARAQARELESILDNQGAWIYIVDPDSCRLKYLNQSVRRDSPAAQPGMICYRDMLGRASRCPDCPAIGIRKKRNDRQIISDGKLGEDVLAEATMIQWQNQESCLMTCHRMPKPRSE